MKSRAAFSKNRLIKGLIFRYFNEFVDFPLKGRFREEHEGPQKRASRAACGLADAGRKD